MKRRIEKDSLSFLILAMARKTKRCWAETFRPNSSTICSELLCLDHKGVRKEKGSVNRKSICVSGFSEIVLFLVQRAEVSVPLGKLTVESRLFQHIAKMHLSKKRQPQPVVCLPRNGPKRQTSEAFLTCSPLSSLQHQIPIAFKLTFVTLYLLHLLSFPL
jgi:hypothetical protein